MKANELRKGNIVYNGYEAGNEKLTAYQIAQIEIMNNGGNVADYYRNLEYIQLTEEWILKFRFEKLNVSVIRYENSNLIVEWLFERWTGRLYADCDSSIQIIELKHVHQLQNLYFALTQKELEIS